MLKLDEQVKVLENRESEHSFQEYRFLSNEDICSVFGNLPGLEKALQENTKMRQIYAGYICGKDERIDDIFRYYEKCGSFLKPLIKNDCKTQVMFC